MYISKKNNKSKKINIIYLSYYNNTPSGGNKIIYKHSELINKANLNFNSKILHFKYKNKNWKIKKIDNLNENKTFKYLLKSKIFLSLSNLEGLGLPPLKAALAGNKVIGYTGEAGKEYWKRPIFKKIYSGDLKKFCKIVLKEINNKIKYNDKSLIKKIFYKYSEEYEKKIL